MRIKEGTETDELGAYQQMEAGKVMVFNGDGFKLDNGLKIWDERESKWRFCSRAFNSMIGVWHQADFDEEPLRYKQKNNEQISFRQAWGYMSCLGAIYCVEDIILKYDGRLKYLNKGYWVDCDISYEKLMNSTAFEMVQC